MKGYDLARWSMLQIEDFTAKRIMSGVCGQVFPYHLSHYACRVLRVSPFRYYSDVLMNSLKNEQAYDKIPNFTVGFHKLPELLWEIFGYA